MLRLGTQRIVNLRTDETITSMQGLIDLTLEKFASRHTHRCDIVRYLFGGLLLELGAALNVPARGDVRTLNAVDLFRQYRDLIQATIGSIGFQYGPALASKYSRVLRRPSVDDPLRSECRVPNGLRLLGTRRHTYRNIGTGDAAFALHDTPDERHFLPSGVFTRVTLHAIFKQRLSVTPEIFRSTAPRDRWVELPSGR